MDFTAQTGTIASTCEKVINNEAEKNRGIRGEGKGEEGMGNPH